MTDPNPTPPSPFKQFLRRTWVLWLIGICVGGGVFWHKNIRYSYEPKNFGTVVEDRIYRSAQLTPRMFRKMTDEHQFKTIIDLTGPDHSDPRKAAERDIAQELGVDRHVFSLVGNGTGDPDQWAQALAIMMDPANEPMLVHCAAGAQRTSTAVILYRHLVQGKTITEAYPESFDYKHEPDEWELPTFLADNLEEIKAKIAQYTAQSSAEDEEVVDASSNK